MERKRIERDKKLRPGNCPLFRLNREQEKRDDEKPAGPAAPARKRPRTRILGSGRRPPPTLMGSRGRAEQGLGGLAAGEQGPGGKWEAGKEERQGGRKGREEELCTPGGLGEAGWDRERRVRVKVPACTPPEPSLPSCTPAVPHSVFAPPAPSPPPRLCWTKGGGDRSPPSSAPRPRVPAHPHSSPPGLAFQSRQIVTLERELRQGQVCFSLEVSKESNLLLHSAADVSGASAPRARLRKQG